LVQGAEKEFVEYRSVKALANGERSIQLLSQEAPFAVQPSFGLNEVQEENSCQGQEGDLAAIARAASVVQRCHHLIEELTKRPKETVARGF